MLQFSRILVVLLFSVLLLTACDSPAATQPDVGTTTEETAAEEAVDEPAETEAEQAAEEAAQEAAEEAAEGDAEQAAEEAAEEVADADAATDATPEPEEEATPVAEEEATPVAEEEATPEAAEEAEESDAAAMNSVDVELLSFEIRMPDSIPAGPTEFTVTNIGEDEHNFEIEGQGIEQEFEQDLQPGESNTMQVDLQPGEYTIYCPVGDHREQGMEMTLTVTE